jgi:signal peptidase I
MASSRAKPKKSTFKSLVELVVTVAVAVGLALLIQAFIVKPYRIPSPSMVPTLEVGQRVLVNRLGTHFGDPHRGDIVVFKPPLGADTHQCGVPGEPADGHPCSKPTDKKSPNNFIKRVIGLPGDHLFVRNNRAYINGKPLNEPYINKTTVCDELCNLQKPITIPPGYFFMMGDNRGESDDSRDWGPVPKKWIIGRAFFTYWPPDRIGTL